ncbi:MAG: pyridoxamine 5'-phosphate oxidase family protein [Alphaproteobacteria bacterium]
MDDHKPATDSRIETTEALRDRYGEPSPRAVQKALPKLDKHCKHYISMSPFLCLGSSQAGAAADVSPRGDAPGFVQVVDDATLLIPDRPGNKRLDSLQNVLANPHIGLLFMIPGIEETLRINGRAEIVSDPARLEELSAQGKVPQSALLVHVDEAYLHCAKALRRSKLWQDDYKLQKRDFPTLGQILKDQLALEPAAADLDKGLEDAYSKTMY